MNLVKANINVYSSNKYSPAGKRKIINKYELEMYTTHVRLLQFKSNSCFNLTFECLKCVWCPQTPSSVFWKELALAMPRRVIFHSDNAGDPQTMLQDDKDPMLTLDPDYLDCRSDTDPAGDLGKSCRQQWLMF